MTREKRKNEMELLIEALRALREAKDWTKGRRTNGVAAERSHRALVKATEQVELLVRESGRDLVKPLGPAQQVPRDSEGPVRKTGGAGPGRGGRASKREREPSARRERRHRTDIPHELIDRQALSVVRRLIRFDYKAYLVGGCVRDLLLGIAPKDFDIATDARPEEVKKAFRNSRIIGRRFRLVHLYFRDQKIIEVSTFRANITAEEEVESDHDLLVRRDNVFGTEEEDARRRDFTINGLFYDVTSGKVIDHVDGLADIRKRHLRMIGDPDIRLREDPVRILRAIRFIAKTGLSADPNLMDAMRNHREDVARCAPARVLEETLRLLRIGHAARTVELMEETGVLGVLLPEVAEYLDGNDEDEDAEELERRRTLLVGHLQALDALVERGPVSDAAVLASVVYMPLLQHLRDHDAEVGPAFNRELGHVLAQLASRIAVTRRLTDQLRHIFVLQRNIGRHGIGAARERRRRRPSAHRLMSRAAFADALNVYDVHVTALGESREEIDRWYTRIEEEIEETVVPPLPTDLLENTAATDDGAPARRPRPRRRRRRR